MGKDNQIEEFEMIRKSLDGDTSQFAILFNRHYDRVKEFLVKLSGNEFDSNDLLQDTFLKAYLNLNKYNKEYTFIQWLYTIARNTFIDHARRKAVKETLLLFDSALLVDLVGDNPEEIMVALERQKNIESKIKSLDKNSRVIIELRYFNGLSYEEISEQLGVPIGTVKNRLFRAKERLTNLYKH
ncbi:MAG: sigma-70 family RNA polymerase sigma factor [Rikenellaceae bacterium]